VILGFEGFERGKVSRRGDDLVHGSIHVGEISSCANMLRRWQIRKGKARPAAHIAPLKRRQWADAQIRTRPRPIAPVT
jgi:hypothetical protein